jgi:hypothetical protein
VHGQQEGSAYNGHFETVCYHPLFLFNDHGDCLAAKLRPGNVSSADDWEELLVPEIDRQQAIGLRVVFSAPTRPSHGPRSTRLSLILGAAHSAPGGPTKPGRVVADVRALRSIHVSISAW